MSDEKTREQRIDDYVKSESKSMMVAVILTLLFGPLGYLYVSPIGALIAIVLAILLGIAFWPLAIVVWLMCVIAAPFVVSNKNSALRKKAELIAG